MKRLWVFILILLIGFGMAINWKSLQGDDIIIDRDASNLKLEMKRWKDECSLALDIAVPTSDSIQSLSADQVKYESADFDVVFDKKDPSTKIDEARCEQGGIEFTIVLKKKPVSNKWTIPIKSTNLQFWYQPALTQEEIDLGHDRPDNVIGSYAVYKIDRKKVYTNKVEAEKYKTGKVFHIYRPKVWDSSIPNPKEIWADLNITDSRLAITIDQKFLDQAKYPVYIDPIFGYNTAGQSTANSSDIQWGDEFANLSGSGNATKISAYMTVGAECIGRAICALYDADDPCNLIQGTDEVDPISTGSNWIDFNFSTQPAISDTTSYTLVHWGDITGGSGDFKLHWDSGASLDRVYIADPYDAIWPVTLDQTTGANDMSLYCTFEAGVTLVVADGTHGHSTDAIALFQAHTLAVAEALHNHLADSPVLTQAHVLAIAEALHNHSSDPIALLQAHQLAMDDALHGHTSDPILLSQIHQLIVNSADHSHLADNIVLLTGILLIVEDALHGHTAENITLSQVHNLLVNAGLHSLASDPIVLSQVHNLLVNAGMHGHLADDIILFMPAEFTTRLGKIATPGLSRSATEALSRSARKSFIRRARDD